MRWLSLLVLLVACGDNGSPCAYVEANDPGNATGAETTGVTVGAGPTDVCGAIDPGHVDGTTQDVDTFRVTTTGGDVLFELAGADDTSLFTAITVRVFDTAPNPTLLAEARLDPTLANHAAFLADLPAGDADLVVTATAQGALSGPVNYRLQLSQPPDDACPALTSRPDYREAGDQASDAGNDVLSIDYTRDPWFAETADAGDAPERTGLSLEAGRSYRLTGESATIPQGDEYLDRDTYELTTDDSTNEVTIRLGWTGQGADLDFHVFDADRMIPVASSVLTSTTGPELQTFAVAPRTHYWLWIGRFEEANPGPPVPYDAAVCATHFFDGVN